MLGDRLVAVRVAREREGGIREGEDEAAMRRVVAVGHRGRDLHGENGIARPDVADLHAEAGACPILRPHRVGRETRDLVRVRSVLPLAGSGLAHRSRPVNTAGRLAAKAATPSA